MYSFLANVFAFGRNNFHDKSEVIRRTRATGTTARTSTGLMSFVFPGNAQCDAGSRDVVLTRISFDNDETRSS